MIRPVFPTICPHCREAGSFVYYDGVDNNAIGLGLLSVLGIFAFLNAPKKILGCPVCDYGRILNDADVQAVLALSESYGQLMDDQISQEVFLEKLSQCRVPFVQEIIKYKHDWQCPECSETNPPDFAICFNCQWENPDIIVEDGNANLPDVGGRHPWECSYFFL